MGVTDLFARHHLDLQAFLRDGGIDSLTLLATGDALAIQIVELAATDAKEAEHKWAVKVRKSHRWLSLFLGCAGGAGARPGQ
jgi:hypothetical protein